MNDIFLVFGYGVPKNILKDEKYDFYLKMVFNKIYSIVAKNRNTKPLIIACGGPTDMQKPYRRTESEEMIKLFNVIVEQRTFLKAITKSWVFVFENKSLSTLENLLNSQEIIRKRKIKKANIFIFCEQTRERRIRVLAKKIFAKEYNFKVLPIDFDTSVNRYLPTEYLAKKEGVELKHSLWALQSSENLKKHQDVFNEKFEYFRKFGNKLNTNVVKEWWDKKLKELE